MAFYNIVYMLYKGTMVILFKKCVITIINNNKTYTNANGMPCVKYRMNTTSKFSKLKTKK